tara:strand:- start:1958 stop:2140 length:183 start_codon:yes stop_codon:yes gene_type:complete
MSGPNVYLTIFIWDGLDYTGPSIVAKTRAEAELICEGLSCQIVRELTNVIVANQGMVTLH